MGKQIILTDQDLAAIRTIQEEGANWISHLDAVETFLYTHKKMTNVPPFITRATGTPSSPKPGLLVEFI